MSVTVPEVDLELIHHPGPRSELDRLHDLGVELMLTLIARLTSAGWTVARVDTLATDPGPDQVTLRRQYCNREWILTRTKHGKAETMRYTDRNGKDGLPLLSALVDWAWWGSEKGC
jgi:hypothetical protein